MTFEQAKIDLFLIGAQKCGTTTVSNELCAHFGYSRAIPAEPRFFLDSGTLLEGWGLSFGAVAGSGRLLDDSTAYSNLPHSARVPARVYEHNPDARIIYCVRNPVDRIRSAIHHRFVKEGWRGTTADLIIREPEFICRSLYRWQVDPWLRLFGRDRVLIIDLDTDIANSAILVKMLEVFLEQAAGVGVGSDDSPLLQANQSRGKRALPPLMTKLLKRTGLRSDSVGWVPRPLRQFATREVPLPDLDEASTSLIRAATQLDVEGMELLLGRDLAAWRA